MPDKNAEKPEPTRPIENAPRIEGHRYLGTLGQGGMGCVYLFEDEKLRRKEAIKVVLEDRKTEDDSQRRFLREARAMATIQHPNVVSVYFTGEQDDAQYFAMEYVEGETLQSLLRHAGALPVGRALDIARQTVSGLRAALEKNLIHRDVKPANLLIDPTGRVRVADFGLAKPLQGFDADPSMTAGGVTHGSPHYMSPEQINGEEIDHRTDIYSLGIVLFEMLSGDRPYTGNVNQILRAHVDAPLPDLNSRRPDLPQALVDLVTKMTSKTRNDRPDSYATLVATLETLLEAAPAPGEAPVDAARVSAPPGEDEDPSLARTFLSFARPTPKRWWEVDNFLAVVVMTPLWIYLGWTLYNWNLRNLGTILLVAIGLCQAVTTLLRLYMLVAAATFPRPKVAREVHRVTPWVRTVDLLFMAVILIAGLSLIPVHTGTGAFLAAIAIAGTIKFLLLDPFVLGEAFGENNAGPGSASGSGPRANSGPQPSGTTNSGRTFA